MSSLPPLPHKQEPKKKLELVERPHAPSMTIGDPLRTLQAEPYARTTDDRIRYTQQQKYMWRILAAVLVLTAIGFLIIWFPRFKKSPDIHYQSVAAPSPESMIEAPSCYRDRPGQFLMFMDDNGKQQVVENPLRVPPHLRATATCVIPADVDVAK